MTNNGIDTVHSTFTLWNESTIEIPERDKLLLRYLQGLADGKKNALEEARRAELETFKNNLTIVSQELAALYELFNKEQKVRSSIVLGFSGAYTFDARYIISFSRFVNQELRLSFYRHCIESQKRLKAKNITLTIGLLSNRDLNKDRLRGDGYYLTYGKGRKRTA